MPSADVFVFHHCCSGQWQREKTNGNTDILHTDFQLYSQSNKSVMKVSYLSPEPGYLPHIRSSHVVSWKTSKRSSFSFSHRKKQCFVFFCCFFYKPVTLGVSSLHKLTAEMNVSRAVLSVTLAITAAESHGMASVQNCDFSCIVSTVSVNFYTVQ